MGRCVGRRRPVVRVTWSMGEKDIGTIRCFVARTWLSVRMVVVRLLVEAVPITVLTTVLMVGSRRFT